MKKNMAILKVLKTRKENKSSSHAWLFYPKSVVIKLFIFAKPNSWDEIFGNYIESQLLIGNYWHPRAEPKGFVEQYQKFRDAYLTLFNFLSVK